MKTLRTTRRLALAGLVLAATSFGMTSAHADQLDTIMAAKKIRVAIDLGVPPYGMKDDKMQSIGSDVETAQLLAKDLGLQLEIVPTTGTNRIPFLETGKCDVVISTLSVTPDRAKVIDFSVPYASILSVVGAPKSMDIKGPADLAGKKVVATRGTTNDQFLTKIAPPGTQIIRFDDDATSITALVSNQADIFATAPPLLKAINDKNPAKQMEVKFVMSTAMLAVGVHKGEPKLLEKVDAWVRANLKNGKLDAIYRKYQGTGLPPDVLKNGA
ncbi:MAG: transporter substrate-binding domain-containing protein [Burkholderiales bacterium]|nr:transporter substrate-binding domain-containing protein [Burkholderiales bacterium]